MNSSLNASQDNQFYESKNFTLNSPLKESNKSESNHDFVESPSKMDFIGCAFQNSEFTENKAQQVTPKKSLRKVSKPMLLGFNSKNSNTENSEKNN